MDKITNEESRTILDSFLNRQRFNYGTSKIFDYLSNCLCCSSKRRLMNKRFKQHYYFQKAEKKLKEELDIVQLLKSTRKLKLLTQAIF
jgi:hypothetical protein